MRAALLLLASLLLPAPAAALKLTTWDLGWLTLRPVGDPALPAGTGPRAAADVALLAAYARALESDVVAFQGVDGAAAAAQIFPADRWNLHLAADTVVQRTGFAVRRGLRFTALPDLAELDPFPLAHYRLRSGADLRLDLPGGTLRLLDVHLKSGCRETPIDTPDIPACVTLRRQGAVLARWVAQREAAGEAFVVLGDFGRIMDGDDRFLAGLAPPGVLTRATDRHASPCWGGAAFVDHILLGGEARHWIQPDSLRVMVFRETGDQWRDRLSAHCPVSVSLTPPP